MELAGSLLVGIIIGFFAGFWPQRQAYNHLKIVFDSAMHMNMDVFKTHMFGPQSPVAIEPSLGISDQEYDTAIEELEPAMTAANV